MGRNISYLVITACLLLVMTAINSRKVDGSRLTDLDGTAKETWLVSRSARVSDEPNAINDLQQQTTWVQVQAAQPSQIRQEAKSMQVSQAEVLLTASSHVTASSRGNLGPPSVVIKSSVQDWLKDRFVFYLTMKCYRLSRVPYTVLLYISGSQKIPLFRSWLCRWQVSLDIPTTSFL